MDLISNLTGAIIGIIIISFFISFLKIKQATTGN
jgi:glycopeptide antibiotics resistance protein